MADARKSTVVVLLPVASALKQFFLWPYANYKGSLPQRVQWPHRGTNNWR